MATNRDLLKEAIADAKAVKEMAIANAKTALEEAFTPRLKEMLSAKIQEMELEEDIDEEMMYDEDESKMEEEMKYEEDDSKMEEAMEYEEDDSKMEEAMHSKDHSDKMEEEMNLEELLAELEEEEKGEVDEGKKSDDKEDVKEGMYEEDDADMDDDDMDGEGEPLDLEDMTDEDLKKMIEDVIADMVASGELEGGDVEDEEEGEEMEMSDEEEVDLTELLKEIEEEMNEEEVTEKKEEVEESVLFGTDASPNEVAGMIAAMIPFVSAATGIAVAAIRSKLSKAKSAKEVVNIAKDLKDDVKKDNMSEEIAELQAENKSLKSDLNEAVKETNATNLLNAKLLYTNKIFKAKNLNENQKVKVLSSFDKANTTKEAKLIYETLNEGLKVKKSTIKENLGRASKATTIPTTKKPIVESNEVFARMQKLAGIIK